MKILIGIAAITILVLGVLAVVPPTAPRLWNFLVSPAGEQKESRKPAAAPPHAGPSSATSTFDVPAGFRGPSGPPQVNGPSGPPPNY